MRANVSILLLAALFAIFQRADASYVSRAPSHDQPRIVLKISDLRSAYLQRAGWVLYDESNRSPAGLRQQLRRHFDVVLGLLSVATCNSIEVAVARLESAGDHSWTAEERNAWRQELLAARLVQLQRLAAYRDRGIFPLNEGQSTHAVPIFVDRHGTACAVGHLMRCSGWSNEVDSIQKTNNLVYVPDARQSAIAEWVLTSGLTLEEAALIQPGYPWPSGQFDASAYGPGGSTLQQGGLVFSNFHLFAENYLEPFNSFTTSGSTPTLTGLGLLAGQGSVSYGGFLQYTPIGTNWISIASGNTQPALHDLNASAATGRGQYVDISFDVATVAANQAINGISETSEGPLWQGFEPFSSSPDFYLDTVAFQPTASSNLAEVYFDQSTAKSGAAQKSASFAAQQQISIDTGVWLENGVSISTYVLDFNVVNVPEPTSGFLAAVLMATCGLVRTRERKK
jgi:hypothetical protein